MRKLPEQGCLGPLPISSEVSDTAEKNPMERGCSGLPDFPRNLPSQTHKGGQVLMQIDSYFPGK